MRARRQDSAKTFYDIAPDTALVDLNRAGTPLLEVVAEPDLRSAADTAAYVSKLQGILQALGASPASLEEVRGKAVLCAPAREQPTAARAALIRPRHAGPEVRANNAGLHAM